MYFIFIFTGDPIDKFTLRENKNEKNKKENEKIEENKIKESKGDNEKETIPNIDNTEKSLSKPFGFWTTCKIAIPFFVLHFVSQYSCNYAYANSSVGSITILLTSSGLFTWLIGVILGLEGASIMKFVSVLVTGGGIFALGWKEFNVDHANFNGNMAALLSAFTYGAYSIYLKWITNGHEDKIKPTLLFAIGGLYTMLLLWPLFFVFNNSGWEIFALPKGHHLKLFFILNSLFGTVLPNYLWLIAFAFTSELVVAIGLSFTLPLTLILERGLYGTRHDINQIIAAIFVLSGFALINLAYIFPKIDPPCRKLLNCLGTKKEKTLPVTGNNNNDKTLFVKK